MSALASAEPDFVSPPARRPGTAARFLLFLAAAGGSALVLTVGFPPGARDRLPVLLLSLALALDAAFRPARAVRDFCYAFPLAGLAASIFGSADPVAWPVLLFGGLAAGWTFRFLYDFESRPDPSRLDGPLRALVMVWAIAAVLALVRARTLWALLHGLAGRAVNGEDLPDAAALRETLLTFAILAAGAAFFFLLRRSRPEVRSAALSAALVGGALSAAAAILQALGLFPEETRPFWKLTGRHSGGATDPNALGLLCGLGIVVLLGLAIGRRERSRRAIGLILPLPVALALSGSRSGFLIALVGSAGVVAFASIRGRLRVALAVGGFALAVAILQLRGSPGAVGGRIGQLFQSAVSLDDRTSSRPILWRAALRLFAESPVEGGGLGSFSWRLPELVPPGVRLPMRDNPGSAYLQSLAETGAVGFVLMLVFVAALVREALARRRDPESSGGAAALAAILLAFVVGSHWLAPEVSLLFFLLAALVAIPQESRERTATPASAVLAAAVGIYAAAALLAAYRTANPAETFRYSRLIGFHPLETGPGGPFRWTRQRFAIRVRADAPQRLSLANYSPEGKPVEMSVRASDVGERVLYRRSVRPGESVNLALRSGGRARAFLFELNRSFVPKRLTGSEDRRELGLLAVLPEDAIRPSR
ncbi:MAG TPA: O-antigen ligase family protein [Thermoanaerobaculia bacterium]|nr:O-antigen ligase family protein [Thermoanaerobaculia bacterium]